MEELNALEIRRMAEIWSSLRSSFLWTYALALGTLDTSWIAAVFHLKSASTFELSMDSSSKQIIFKDPLLYSLSRGGDGCCLVKH
jgi:hypothetical protein